MKVVQALVEGAPQAMPPGLVDVPPLEAPWSA
jgi:hypothetical protein